jgi:hypothetical protein
VQMAFEFCSQKNDRVVYTCTRYLYYRYRCTSTRVHYRYRYLLNNLTIDLLNYRSVFSIGFYYLFITSSHGITCFHGTLVLNASYNLPPPSQTLLTSMILAYLKTPRPDGPGHGEQVTASAT